MRADRSRSGEYASRKRIRITHHASRACGVALSIFNDFGEHASGFTHHASRVCEVVALITAGTRIITCVSRVLYVITTCAVRACPRSKVLSSTKIYSASDAVQIFPHVLSRLQRDCSSSSTRTTSAVSRETTF